MAGGFREYLRLSIVCLFSLTIFFFLCIFLLSVAHTHEYKNIVSSKVPIQ